MGQALQGKQAGGQGEGKAWGQTSRRLNQSRADLAEVQGRPWLSHLLRAGAGQGRLRGSMTVDRLPVDTWEAASRPGLRCCWDKLGWDQHQGGNCSHVWGGEDGGPGLTEGEH